MAHLSLLSITSCHWTCSQQTMRIVRQSHHFPMVIPLCLLCTYNNVHVCMCIYPYKDSNSSSYCNANVHKMGQLKLAHQTFTSNQCWSFALILCGHEAAYQTMTYSLVLPLSVHTHASFQVDRQSHKGLQHTCQQSPCDAVEREWGSFHVITAEHVLAYNHMYHIIMHVYVIVVIWPP